jgi:Ser/Thr protein kinase RdoA (MazF antagonist)
VAATVLASMHRRWEGRAPLRWPWLRPAAAAADLVEQLFSRTWARLRVREDLPSSVAALGEALTGRVTGAEHAIAAAGPLTLVHGDASLLNMRTSPDGEVALVDWEDVSARPGVADLAWMLTSSVDPARWDEVIAAYGPAGGLSRVLPATVVQGLLSLADTTAGSAAAMDWISRLDAAARRM